MPSLRDYRDRIKSVKSTKKITSAMKMVAASKLRRAQEQAQASQPYAEAMADILSRVAGNVVVGNVKSKLLQGTGSDKRHLLVVVTSDRGLCGGFNSNVIRESLRHAYALLDHGKEVSIICAGRKGHDIIAKELKSHMWRTFTELTGKTRVDFADANEITKYILNEFDQGNFDVCTLIYNEFKSVMVQKPHIQQLIPFKLPEDEGVNEMDKEENSAPLETNDQKVMISPYDFEPSKDEILDALLPKNIAVQIFRALLDSSAGEQAARMTAMDGATRNAGEMIKDLTLQYNRARQAYITKELIEIISGAEAV